jgi:hypothetical protein
MHFRHFATSAILRDTLPPLMVEDIRHFGWQTFSILPGKFH